MQHHDRCNSSESPEGISPTPVEFLGLPAASDTELSVDQIYRNRSAVSLVINYLRLISSQNTELRNEISRLRAIEQSHQVKSERARISAILLAVSNLGTGGGMGMWFAYPGAEAAFVFLFGVGLMLGGLYYLLRES